MILSYLVHGMQSFFVQVYFLIEKFICFILPPVVSFQRKVAMGLQVNNSSGIRQTPIKLYIFEILGVLWVQLKKNRLKKFDPWRHESENRG